MNSLSWLIYLANVAGKVNFVLWLAVFFLFAAAAFAIANRWNDDYVGIQTGEVARVALGSAGRYAIALALIAAVIPSSNTIYAIAASEMGERALNTETGGKAVQALNAWLDKQISDKGDE